MAGREAAIPSEEDLGEKGEATRRKLRRKTELNRKRRTEKFGRDFVKGDQFINFVGSR